MNRARTVVIALSSMPALGACGSEPSRTDLSSRQLYAGWDNLSHRDVRR